MEFGASTYVLPRRLDGDTLDEFRSAGVSLIEIGSAPVFVNPDDEQQHAAIRDHLARTGMRVHSIHAGHGLQFTMSAEDPSVRRETVRQARDAARIATALGGDVVVVHPGGPVAGVDDLDAFTARVVNGLPTLVDAVANEGARVALENANPRGFPSDPRVLMELVRMFPEEQVGVCIDVGHANLTSWGMNVIREAAGRIITTHLHDNHGPASAALDEHLAPGHGTVDWNAVMRTFRRAGYRGPWIFECGRPDEPALERLAGAMNLLLAAWTESAQD